MNKILATSLFYCLTLAILININWLKINGLSLGLGLIYILTASFILGRKIIQSGEKSWQILNGFLALVSFYTIWGTLIYYFYRLDLLSVSIIIGLNSLLCGYLLFQNKIQDRLPLRLYLFQITTNIKTQSKSLWLSFSYLILWASCLLLLIDAQVVIAINSPWQVISKVFFILYFLATLNLVLIFYLAKPGRHALPLALASAHFFLSAGIALIVYKLGFGFDSFIHQATELAIWQNGQILPKPFYYLGQYSLVINFNYLLQVAPLILDKLLVPLLFSLLLPGVIYFSLKKTFGWETKYCLLLTLPVLFLPYALFIVTTPQALANFFVIIIIFLSLPFSQDQQIPHYFLIILALASLAIHALAGIPIIIYLGLLYLLSNKSRVAKIILAIFAVGSSLAIPLALFINSLLSIYKFSFNLQTFNLLEWPTIFTRQYNYFLDLVYLYKLTWPWILVFWAAVISAYLIKNKQFTFLLAGFLTFFILAINAVILNFVKISSIINYEQSEFSKRVWQMAFYFLLPLIIYAFHILWQKARLKPFIYSSFLFIIFSLALTVSLYLSYPRFDDYDNSKFINLSQYDTAAVNFIEKDSQGQPYIVLANQMTSAAALQKFGFTRYYNNYYFYPIPTGEKLYSFFEQMIYDYPAKKTALEAMNLSGVKIAYFVLPDYWSRFNLIKEQAQKTADSTFSLDDKIFIFKYTD